jgi:hypothetical protein
MPCARARRERESLGKAADRGRALAEEALRDALVAAVLRRHRRAGRDRYVAADDAVPAEEVLALVEDVHRAAEALHAPGLLAVELGHDRARRRALGVRVAVLAVRRDDVVLGLERGDRANAHRLLADDQVEEAADLARRVRLGGRLLEAPDREHLPVQRRQLVGRRRDVLGIVRFDALGVGSREGSGRHGATIPIPAGRRSSQRPRISRFRSLLRSLRPTRNVGRSCTETGLILNPLER